MECAELKTMPLADVMPEQAALWRRLTDRTGLSGIELRSVVNWGWLDYILRREHDVVLETGKVFVERLRALQQHKLLPR